VRQAQAQALSNRVRQRASSFRSGTSVATGIPAAGLPAPGTTPAAKIVPSLLPRLRQDRAKIVPKSCHTRCQESGDSVSKSVSRLPYGGSGVGVNNPKFRGLSSRYLPQKLQQRVIEFLDSDEALSLEETIAVCSARVSELYERLNASALVTQRDWAELERQFSDILDLIDNYQIDEARNEVERLTQQAHHVSQEDSTWREIVGMWETRRRLIETEQKRLRDARLMISGVEAMTLAVILLESVRRHVQDEATLAAIQHEFSAALNYRTMEQPTVSIINLPPS
jgi:hypothetical protein